MINIVAVISILAAVVSILTGALGVRAANDNQKIMPVWILSIIALAALASAVVSIIMAIVQGNFARLL